MYRGWRSAAVALVATMVLTSGALAQRGGGGFGRQGGGINMLRMPEVQTELKLTADQKTKVEDLMTKLREQRGDFQSLRDLSQEERAKVMAERRAAENKELGAILNADQMKRYGELRLQRQGMTALAEKEVADQLTLTADQRTKVQEILQAQAVEMRSLFQGGGDREANRAKMEEMRKATDVKLAALLTDDQKKKWQEMVGAPFTFPAPGSVRAVS